MLRLVVAKGWVVVNEKRQLAVLLLLQSLDGANLFWTRKSIMSFGIAYKTTMLQFTVRELKIVCISPFLLV